MGERALRPYAPEDRDAVVGVWLAAGKAEYSYLQVSSQVGTHEDDVVAYPAMQGSGIGYIARMHVAPREWGRGWASRFVAFARERRSPGLERHTHQANTRARVVYSAPDVEYHWRPDPP